MYGCMDGWGFLIWEQRRRRRTGEISWQRGAACSQAFRGSVETRGDWDWHRVCVKGERLGNDGSTSEAELHSLWPSVLSSSMPAKNTSPCRQHGHWATDRPTARARSRRHRRCARDREMCTVSQSFFPGWSVMFYVGLLSSVVSDGHALYKRLPFIEDIWKSQMRACGRL